MGDIERNKISKNDNKQQIAEKINNCNTICLEYLEKYKKLFEQISNIKDLNQEILKIQNSIEVDKIFTKIEKIKEFYTEFLIETIDEDGKKCDSIKANIEDTETKLNELYNKYFYNKDENGNTIENKLKNIKESYETIIENKDSIKNTLEEYHKNDFKDIQEQIEQDKEEIQNYKNELLGNNKDSEDNSIKKQINEIYRQIKEYNNEIFEGSNETESIKLKIDDLVKEANNLKNTLTDLLPDAASAGLSYDYNKGKQDYGLKFKNVKDEVTDKIIQERAFWATIFNNALQYLMFFIPLGFMAYFNYKVIIETPLQQWDLYFILKNMSFTLPLLWISLFGSKTITLRRRMYEEYNHKEKVLKLFSTLGKELVKHDFKDDKIKYYDKYGNIKEITQYQRLIEIVLNTVEYNPSKILGAKDESILSQYLGIRELKLKIKDLELQLETKNNNNTQNENE